MAREEIAIGDVRWVCIQNPTEDDFSFVRDLNTFDEIVLDYISSPTLHPLLEEFGDSLYFVLHFPIIFRSGVNNKVMEIDFLLTKKMLITITYERYDQLETLFQECRTDTSLQQKYFRVHSGYPLYLILERLYKSMIHDHDYIEKSINSLEKDIFSGTNEKVIGRIADVAQDVLDFRRVFGTQASVLELLPHAIQNLLDKTSIPRFTNLMVTQNRIQRLIDNHKETIDSLQATYGALIDNKISRIMKVLTIFSAIMLPLTLVAGIWGMNQRVMPFRDGAYDFAIVIGLMLSITCAMLMVFKRAKWF